MLLGARFPPYTMRTSFCLAIPHTLTATQICAYVGKQTQVSPEVFGYVATLEAVQTSHLREWRCKMVGQSFLSTWGNGNADAGSKSPIPTRLDD